MSLPQNKRFAARRLLCLLLALAFGLALAGCGSSASSEPAAQDQEQVLTDDALYELTAEKVDQPLYEMYGVAAGVIGGISPLGGTGLLLGTFAGAAVWHGVQTFCSNFNYTAQQFTAADTSLDAAKAALNSAAQSGAGLVVCYGSEMAAALYDIQDNYPTVSYLMIGDEPHSEDYTNYRTSANVHCVLFREEQAAYLAGYAAVQEGNTSMAVLGGEPLPSTVRYATGFVQGAEAAADSMGVQVYIRIWYSSMTASDDDLTDYVCGWYNEGFQVVMAATPELADSCIQAAEKSGREVIATGWDCAGQGSSVITSAVNCYSTVVQNELYLFGTQNNWDQNHSGQTETLGTEVDAVGLATQEWRLKTFTGNEYRELYQRMAAGTVKVERYSDTTAMPQTQNVTVDQPNR